MRGVWFGGTGGHGFSWYWVIWQISCHKYSISIFISVIVLLPARFLSSFFTFWQFSGFEGIWGFLDDGEFGIVLENGLHLEHLEFARFLGIEFKRSKSKPWNKSITFKHKLDICLLVHVNDRSPNLQSSVVFLSHHSQKSWRVFFIRYVYQII